MKNIQRFILYIVFSAIAFIVSAQDASVKVIPPSRAIEGETFTVTFRVTNGKADFGSNIQINGCTLRYGPGVSTVSSVQYINGNVTQASYTDYTYRYYADKAGTFTIPAVNVNINGKRFTTEPVKFNVAQSNRPVSPAPQQPADVRADNTLTQTVKKIQPSDLIVKVLLSKTKVYEQEALIATIKVYTKYGISSFSATTLPTFEGALSEELDVSNAPQGYEDLNGQNYYSAVLKKCLIFPQKSGKLTINSGSYDVTVVQYVNESNGFFIMQRPVEQHVTTTSNSVSIDVMPLPSPIPQGFSGAVGSYSASTEMSPLSLRTNEATSLKYVISGTGNVKFLKAPSFNVPHGIEEYNPQTKIDAKFNGSNMDGTFAIDYTFIPQDPGDYTIETGNFVYFDPVSKTYKTIELPSYELHVEKGSSVATTIDVSQKQIAQMKDVHHIKQSSLQPQHKFYTFIFHSPFYWAIYILLFVTLILIIVIYRKQIRRNADVSGRRLAKANKEASKRLKKARTYMKEHHNDEFYNELTKSIWGYLSDKLGIPASQLLRDNVASQLADYGADETTINDIIGILDDCEMARFTPEHSDSEVAQIYNRATSAIKSIEDIKRKH